MIVSKFIQETRLSPFQLSSVTAHRGSDPLINREDVPLTVNLHPEALSTVPVSAQLNSMFGGRKYNLPIASHRRYMYMRKFIRKRKYIPVSLQARARSKKERPVCALLKGGSDQPLLNIATVEGKTFSLLAYPATIFPAQSIILVEPIVLRL